jgi:hypothetical protein
VPLITPLSSAIYLAGVKCNFLNFLSVVQEGKDNDNDCVIADIVAVLNEVVIIVYGKLHVAAFILRTNSRLDLKTVPAFYEAGKFIPAFITARR